MGDAMKAAASSEKEREEGTEVENSNDETETVAERARKRKGKGWMEFSELNVYYYPYLIQEFYGSMKEESFSVRVKKKSQIIDVDFLASVLNLPNDGNRIGTFKDSRKLDGYDEKAFQLSIFPEAMGVHLSKEKKFSNPIPIKEIFKADDGRKRSKKEDKKQEEETEIEIESESESDSKTESDIPLSKWKENNSKIDEGESSKKKEKMKLKMSDFVKISKANLDMMKEIKEMSGLTLNILEKSHELQKGIMAKHNAKMDMLINRLDRQEWFMKKMAQMLFGESFGKFGDFGSYPQGTAGPSNAKATGPSGVKISEVEEEEEEHVEAAEKVQEESKLAEVEEIEKNDEKEKSAEEASETEQEPANETSRESSSSHTTSNSSSDNGKSEGRNGSRQEKEKEEQSQDLNIVPTASQPVPESTISLPMQYGPRRTKTQARKSILPIPPKIQVPITEKEPPKKKKQAKLVDPTHLRRSGRILSNKEKS
ncbi:uncharacterized protein LOC131172215 [Hevea brasiliensis]|uniref:uncharacterized protein LOC131172215 n=1 Tax=Hevea brasiliensis TaxID=3981 RepID=UPI0025D8B235|nr:uncharacterized protein LOC131172215 [Hevea brasiliensis]